MMLFRYLQLLTLTFAQHRCSRRSNHSARWRSVQKFKRRDLRSANRPLDDARWLVSRYTALQCSPAAESRHGIAVPQARRQTLADFPQHRVADVVTVGIVERLESVQVDEQESGVVAATRAAALDLLEPIHEQLAGRQPHQLIEP